MQICNARRSSTHRLLSLVAALGMTLALVSACASNRDHHPDHAVDGDDTMGDVATGLVNVQSPAGEPADSGTLTFASFAPVASMDPAVTKPDGAAGGTELAAVYGLLARYDYESNEFVHQLAKAITSTDDATEWTITLRDGVTFSDGAPLDAQAVVQSIDRYNSHKGSNAELYQDIVESTVATAPDTVTVTLTSPWPEFPALLAGGHGMIVAPSAYADGTFTPVGAGPFTVSSLDGQKLTLTARADYWNGTPHLDGVDFVALAGDDNKRSTLRNGGVDVAYIFTSEDAAEISEDSPGFLRTDALGSVGQINTRAGHPGSDPRVRKAIAYAINPERIDERTNNGYGLPGTDIFPRWSRWHGTSSGVTPDPDKAAELLSEAEDDGYDGHLTYVGVNTHDGQQLAVAVQSMLDAVGFDVRVDYASDPTDMTRRLYATHDFDLAYSFYNVSDAAPAVRLFGALNSTSANNVTGYANSEMDTLLKDALAASDDEQKTSALGAVQDLVDDDQPFSVWGARRSFIAWNPDVHGITPSDNGILLLGKAWKD